MTLPFAGLARARARMIGGRLEGEAQKWNQDQEEAQRLFREWATRKWMEQAEEAQRYTRERNTALDAERKADRAATLARQNQTDQLDAIKAGGEDAPEMTTAQLLAGLSMMQGGTGSSSAAIKAPRTSAYKAKVGGVDIQAEDMGGPSYATVGGRMFRFDRQKGANAAARQRAEKEQLNIAEDNRRTQATLAAIGARQGGGGGGQSASGGMPPADNKDEMPLRKEFNQEMTRHTQIAPALAKIKESAKLGTGQGDIGIIYGFMRLQDPGSTVREGEYATAQNSAGVEDKVRQAYNNALSGQKLAPDVRANFVAAADRLGQTEREQARKVIERYAGLATRYGMSADAIVYDPYDAVYGMYQGAGKQGVGTDGRPFGQRRPLSQIVGGVR